MLFYERNDDNLNLEQFDPTNITPSKWFMLKTQYKLTERFVVSKITTAISNLTGIQLPAVNLITPAFLTLLVLLPGLAFGPNLYKDIQLYRIKQTVDTRALYQHALEQRSFGLSQKQVSQTSEVSFASDANSRALAPESSLLIAPESPYGESYNYTEYTAQTKYGPAITRCTVYDSYAKYGIDGYTTTDVSLTTDEGAYYSKNETKSLQGELINFSLWTDQTSIEYREGDYAIKYIYPKYENLPAERLEVSTEETNPVESSDNQESTSTKEETDDPGSIVFPIGIDESETPPPVDDPVKDESGSTEPGAGGAEPIDTEPTDPEEDLYQPNLVGTETIEGTEYYIFETPTFISCDDTVYDLSISFRASDTNAISRYWVSADSGDFYKEQLYIDQVKPQNLLVESTSAFNYQTVDAKDKLGDFVFPYNVPLQTIDESNYYLPLHNYLKGNQLVVLTPAKSRWELSSMYSAVAEQEQYQKSLIFNRAYYAQSTLGQAAYEDQQSLLESSTTGYIRSLLDASFTDKNGTLYLSETIYDDNNDEATILDQVLGTDREMYETQSMALTIGGKSINATAYIFDESSIPSTKPMRLDGDTTELMAPETMPEVYDDTAYTSATIIFTHDGFRYVLAVSGSAELSAAWESISTFTALDTAKPQQRQQLIDLVKNLPDNGDSVIAF